MLIYQRAATKLKNFLKINSEFKINASKCREGLIKLGETDTIENLLILKKY